MATVPEVVINITEATVARLDARPGDTVVVHCGGLLSVGAVARIREQLKALFPDNQVMVMTSGFRLGVLREGTDTPVYLDAKEGG